MRLDPRDRLFSLLVRARTDGSCERCGRYFGMSATECAHIFPRRYRGTRWDPQNAIALCNFCHAYFTDHPLWFNAWVVERIGPDAARLLRLRAHAVCHLSQHDLKLIRYALADEWRAMEAKRAAGETGRVEFASPYPGDRA